METIQLRMKNLIWQSVRACGAILLVLALSSCKPHEKIMYLLYNYSGKPILAPTVHDSSGGHGAIDSRIRDQDMWPLGTSDHIRRGASVTIEWIGGEGRARWYQATLPIKIEQAGGTKLEIYLRPDQQVCASLVDDAHASNHSNGEGLARVKTDSAKLSCTMPVELPRLATDMARGFKQDAVSHSWELYDHKGTSTLTFQTLAHDTGPVRFRYGTAFGGGPGYASDFYSVKTIGKQAAWLVKAALRPANPGMFVVTGDTSGWKSRFLGAVEEEETRLSDTRVLIGKEMVVDTATAEIYMLPRFTDIDYWVLGLSKDGKHLAIYWQRKSTVRKDGAGTEFNFTMLNLEDGRDMDANVQSIPSLPPDRFIYKFYGDWYRGHCDWTPLLVCK